MPRPRLYSKERRMTLRLEATLYLALEEWASSEPAERITRKDAERKGISVNTLIQRELAKAVFRNQSAARSEIVSSQPGVPS